MKSMPCHCRLHGSSWTAGTLAPVAFWTVLLAPCLSSVLPCASGASMAAPAASSGRRHDPAMAVKKGRAHHERYSAVPEWRSPSASDGLARAASRSDTACSSPACAASMSAVTLTSHRQHRHSRRPVAPRRAARLAVACLSPPQIGMIRRVVYALRTCACTLCSESPDASALTSTCTCTCACMSCTLTWFRASDVSP